MLELRPPSSTLSISNTVSVTRITDKQGSVVPVFPLFCHTAGF